MKQELLIQLRLNASARMKGLRRRIAAGWIAPWKWSLRRRQWGQELDDIRCDLNGRDRAREARR